MAFDFREFFNACIENISAVFAAWKDMEFSGIGLINVSAYTIIIAFLVLEILIPFIFWKKGGDD